MRLGNTLIVCWTTNIIYECQVNIKVCFLTDEVPSSEVSEGPYPTIITQASGRTVLVVQAYAWGKYMGLLNVTFDDAGEVDSWAGAPVVLDKTIKQGTNMDLVYFLTFLGYCF